MAITLLQMLSASSVCFVILQDNYGRGNLEAVQRVKKLYYELELEPLFKQYEADSHDKLLKMIHQQEVLPPAVFTMLLNKIYKRTK